VKEGEGDEGGTEEPADVADSEEEVEEAHPLRSLLVGDDKKAAPLKVTAPVKKFFADNNLGDAEQVLAELPTLRRTNLEQRTKLEAQAKDLEYLSKLSPAALNMVQKDLAGEDWESEVASTPRFDWRKPAEQQDPKALDKAYGEGKITEEEWREYLDKEGDPTVKKYVQAHLDLCNVKYGADQDKQVNYLQRLANEQKADVAKYTKSLDASEANLYATVPGSEVHGAKLKKQLTPKNVQGLFFEDDGVTVKLNALLDFWLVTDREAVLGTKLKRVQREVKADATKDFLRRTPAVRETPRNTGGRPEAKDGVANAKAYLRANA
jgi:hypothetical protein